MGCITFGRAGDLITSSIMDTLKVDINEKIITFEEGSSVVVAYSTTIEVAKFASPDLGIEIVDLPDVFREFLDNPVGSEPNPVYRERTFRQIEEWKAEHRFVLYTWGKEYWLNSDGSVFAT